MGGLATGLGDGCLAGWVSCWSSQLPALELFAFGRDEADALLNQTFCRPDSPQVQLYSALDEALPGDPLDPHSTTGTGTIYNPAVLTLLGRRVGMEACTRQPGGCNARKVMVLDAA